MVSRREVLQLASGVSVAALAGCFGGGSSPEDSGGGGDGGGGDGGANETRNTPGIAQTTRPYEQIGTSTAAREYPSYSWGELDGVTPVNTNEVTVGRNPKFEPMVIRVPPGTEVTWTNNGNNRHTVTIPQLGKDNFLFGGKSVSVTFEEPGTYNYLCKQHSPNHIGRVVVDETITLQPGAGGTPTDSG